MAGVWLACFAMAACTDSTDDGPADPTDETDTLPSGDDDDDDDDDTTGPLRQDEGSLVLAAWLPWSEVAEPSTLLTGLFVEDDLGWANLAQCASTPQAFCTTTIPQNPGESVVVSAYDTTIIDLVTTRDVGDPVRLGVLEASREQTTSGQYYYYGAWAEDELPPGDLGVHLSGDWGPYDGTKDATSPDPIEVTSPDPMANTEIYDNAPLHLTWTPGTNGDVFLYVSSLFERRLYRLEDTGSYDLDLTALGLPDRTRVDLTLGRWTFGTVDHDGHEVAVIVQSNQQLKGTWRVVGARDEMVVYDTCAEAEAAAPVPSGSYFTQMGNSFRDNLNPGANACIEFAMPGAEGLFPVDLEPSERLTVSYTLLSEDAGLYFVTDCNRPTNTCLDGNDLNTRTLPENLQYINDGTETQRVYVVLDSFRGGAIQGIANVDVDIGTASGDILEPTCAEAMAQGPVQPGVYFGSIAGNADLLDPSCVGGTAGGEGLAQIYLLPDQTLTATVTTADANPSMYLMYNCSIADSCFEGVNGNPTPDSETLVYQNLSGFSEFVYLAVDSPGAAEEYVLDIAIQ